MFRAVLDVGQSLRAVGVGLMYCGCSTIAWWLFSRAGESAVFAILVVPVTISAALWGRMIGLLCGAFSAIVMALATTVIGGVFHAEIMIAGCLVFVGVGGLIGRLFEIRRELSIKGARLEEALRELSKTQEQRQRTKRMEAIGGLAAGVAHDFNNILMGIRGHAVLLQRKIPDGDPLLASVEGIVAATGRAERIVDGLQAAVGTQLYTPRGMDLNDIARSAATPETSGTRLSYRLWPSSLPVQVDAGLMQQVIGELIANASAAMDGRGEILIETSCEALDRSILHSLPRAISESYGCLSVVDSGKGIEVEVQSRMFEPYFTTQQFGAGAGLDQVHQDQARQNGQQTAQHVVDEGLATESADAGGGADAGEPGDDRGADQRHDDHLQGLEEEGAQEFDVPGILAEEPAGQAAPYQGDEDLPVECQSAH